MIDLRSDTVTRPTPAMRQAMATAEVGDDVFGDDPTVNRLQDESARLLGKEAALLVPSGTMANLVAVRTHTEPGDEIVLEKSAHIYVYEGAGFAGVAGVSVALVDGDRGIMEVEDVERAIRPGTMLSHFPPTKLIALENTSNRGGGSVYPMERIAAIGALAHERKISLHLDGARMWNAAVVVAGQGDGDVHAAARAIARPFDTISFCLSKGLGCPAGSLVVGSAELIARAHRFRKMFGGGMRQAGILAAAGLHALEHHIDRLADDHRHARQLAEGLLGVSGLGVELAGVETNMVYIDTPTPAADFAERLQEQNVLVVPTGASRLRAVTHLEISAEDITAAISAFARVAGSS